MLLPPVTVVIPALNEAMNLPYVLPLIPRWVSEIILVDGRSTDGTPAMARSLRPEVKVIEQDGLGKGDALRAGFKAASGDIIVMLDADGSGLPGEIASFVGALVAGADFAKGSRFAQGGGTEDITTFRRLGNKGFVLMTRLLFGGHYTDLCYGYNAFWKRHLALLNLDADGFEIETLMNLRALYGGLKVVEISSFEARRRFGESRLRPVPDGFRVLRTVLWEWLRRPTLRHRRGQTPSVAAGSAVTSSISDSGIAAYHTNGVDVPHTNGVNSPLRMPYANGVNDNDNAAHTNGVDGSHANSEIVLDQEVTTLAVNGASQPPLGAPAKLVASSRPTPQPQVVILCGGLGSRLRPLTSVLPKPLVSVAGRPILWHTMSHYATYGFKKFTLCLGYNGDLIEDYFVHEQLRSVDLRIRLPQKPVGFLAPADQAPDWDVTLIDTGDPDVQTGARLRRVEQYIESPYFLCTYGDAVADVDLAALVAFHQSHGRAATVTGVPVPHGADASRFGALVIKDETRVERFVEKGNGSEGCDYINGGYFVFDRGVFDYLSSDDDCVLERTPIERLAADDHLRVFKHHGYWHCMDTPEDRDALDRVLTSDGSMDLGREPSKMLAGVVE
jgi:glucose-1-phosphate cytidylyltransferase